MIRTFVAVEVSSEVLAKARQIIADLSQSEAEVSWVDPRNLHLTLAFLGNVDPLEIHKVCSAVTDAVAELPPFDLLMQGVGAFPAVDRPRTIWLGTSNGTEEMIALHDAVQKNLGELGFRQEQRRFRPHLTLGRVKGSYGMDQLAERITARQDDFGGATDVAEVVVFSSELKRVGPEYEALCHAPLAGA